MPSADKRARQKENARAARLQREAQEKRRKRTRSTIIFGVGGALIVGLFVIATIAGNDTKETSTANGCSTSVPDKGEQQSFDEPDLPTLDPSKTYIAAVETSCGQFNITLDAENAPEAAANFVFLAREGFYDGLQFNRAAKDFVVQVGDYEGDASGGPGYTITTETPKTPFATGDVGWAKTGTDPAGSAGSQFFVVTGDQTSALNQKVKGKIQYAKFGTVTSGLDVAQKINSFSPPEGDGAPTQDVYIDKVTITET